MQYRKNFQTMGYWLNEPAIRKPELAIEGVRALADEKYDLVRVMLRNTNFTHRSPRVVEVVSAMVEEAHTLGLRLALDCEPHYRPVASDMGREYPEAMAERLVRGSCGLVDGHFNVHIPSPFVCSHLPTFAGVVSAFIRQDGTVRKLDEFDFELRNVNEAYADGFITSDDVYTPGRAMSDSRMFHLVGRLPGEPSGELIVYIRVADSGLVDFWSDGLLNYYDSLLECYRGIPLDGIGWDEPGQQVFWDAYYYGTAFADAFRTLNGYDLCDRLYLMDGFETSPDAVKVRLDYYRTLNEGLYRAQRNLIAKTHELFGPDVVLGTHHTWMGEGSINDYRAGEADYFRLNENMEAGYTDNCWWDDGSVCYTFVLGSSLGRLTPSGAHESNSWNWKPSNSMVDYYTRFMTLMRTNWFNIWYGEDGDTCQYPDHYTWDMSNKCMRRNRRFLEMLGDAQPVADIAIWHGWEGVMAINRAGWATAHKTCLINTSEVLVHRNVAFDFVDSSLIADAEVADGMLHTKLGSYKVLIMPYACVVPRSAWEVCLKFAESGGKVIFTGAPPDQTVEGDSLADKFAQMVGIKPVPLEKYVSYVDAVCTLPEDRPARIDISYPVDPTDAQHLFYAEDSIHGAARGESGITYLSDLDPRSRLANLLDGLVEPPVTCYSDSILWRLYQHGETRHLLLIARKDRQMRGLVRFAGSEIEVSGGRLALLTFADGGVLVETDDADCAVRVSTKQSPLPIA